MARFMRLWFAAVSLIAAAIMAFTTASGWAFSQQTLGPGGDGNYNFNYSDPDHATSSQSTRPSDSNSPGFHFSVQQNQTGPFGGFQSSGSHFMGSGSNATPPDYYSRPLGNGN